MTNSALDVLGYTQDMENAGLPREQAEAIVRNTVGILEQSLGKLVTHEQFVLESARVDQHFSEVRERFEQVDRRFEEIDRRFEEIDRRFEEMDRRFEQIDRRFDSVYGELRSLGELIERQGKTHMATMNAISSDMRVMKVLIAILTVTVIVPTLTQWFNP